MSVFLKNAWYVAAWAEEVTAGKFLPRRLLDHPVVLFRQNDGRPIAMLDRCPHRFAPLHRGRLRDDRVQCGYHGLEFNSAGECVHNPHGKGAIPHAARVRVFPLVEKFSLLWIWMGSPDLADPQLIPDFSFQNPDSHVVGKRYMYVKANYLLEVDNIMDLSHIQFVHPTTLGSSAVSEGTTHVFQEGETVWSKRSTHAEIMPEFLYRARNIPLGTLVDRWIDVRWNAPAAMALFAGAVPTGEAPTPEAGVSQCHIFTPETAATTHYWFGISFDKRLGDLAVKMAEEQIAGLKIPFEDEDLPMLEAQQGNVGDADFWSLNPVLLSTDGGSVRARRLLDRKIAEEKAREGAPA
jgi:phenylpropionate dioxygenase-like ring-hydroxylating dioxygenase large terminal subunit